MAGLQFRNIDTTPLAPVRSWPAEAIETALHRGALRDWRRIAAEIRRSPWGKVARTVADVASWGEHGGVDALMTHHIDHCRASIRTAGRRRWANHIRQLRADTGLSMRAFAALAGTSASRLSDYENCRVAPTTDVLSRIEHAVEVAAS